MLNIIEIHRLDLPQLDLFARLTEAQLRNKLEPEKGIFIAETPKVIACALDAGCVPVSFLVEERQIHTTAREVLERCEGVPIYTGEEALLSALTGFPLSRGVLCAMKRPRLPAVEQLCANAHRIAVLEGIADATNIGAIFRSAAALNMDAVLLTPTCTDPLKRRSVRVSMGTLFQIGWTRIGSTAADWPAQGMTQLRQLGFTTLAMALCDDSMAIHDPMLRTLDKLAIVLGTEGDGLCRRTIAQCDYTVRIPMSHHVDSLNVAAASAVAFWQLRYHAFGEF